MQLRPFAPRAFGVAVMLTVWLAPSATAQYESDFEALTGSPSGTMLTGQDGYYIPAGTTSVDFNVHTYAGNPLGIPANPFGGAQFIAAVGPGTVGGVATFARAQRDMPYPCAGLWTVGFDVLVGFNGTLPAAQNLGSVSIQPFPGSQSFIALARWTDTATATNWNADYVYFDAGGTQITGTVADPAFQNLAVDTWYRWETDFDLTTNQIVEIRLTDLSTLATVTNAPSGWYMEGGSAGGPAPPTGFRFFTGSTVPGNFMGFDNPGIVPRGDYGDFAPGCAGTNGVPSLSAAPGSRPQIASTFTVQVTSMPTGGGAAFLITGFSDTVWGAFTLPLDLRIVAMPGCLLATDVAAVTNFSNAGGAGRAAVRIPNLPTLLAVEFFQQALVIDRGANLLGATLSNAAVGCIGR